MSVSDPIVLIAVETLGGGGAERVALDLVRHWPNGDARPVLLLAHRTGALLGEAPPDLEILEVGVSSSPRSTVRFLRRLRELLHGRSVVGVVSHMTGMNRMMLRASKLGFVRAPVIVVEHNDFVRNNSVACMPALKWMLLRREISWLYSGARAVVGCSEGVARQVARLFDLPVDKVCAIVNPLDRRFLAVPNPDPLLDGQLAKLPRPLMVSVGRMVPQKGFDDLLRVFACLESGSLVILGEGPLRADLERLAGELGVSDRLWMPGFLRAPEKMLREADLYVSASHWEGYPLTLVEAYASGLPVVARACDFGPEEIVTSDRPGRLVRSQSVEALATAIDDTLLCEPRFIPGSRVDLTIHDPDQVARRYSALLEGKAPPLLPPKRLRILMLAPQLGYGGAEGSFLRLSEALATEHDVRIVLFRLDYGSKGYSNVVNQTNLPITFLDDGETFGRVRRWLRRWHRLHVLKSDSDVALSFLSGPNLLNTLTANFVPTIISERGSKRFDTGMTRFKRWLWTRVLDPLTYHRAHHIVAASQGLEGEIVSANPDAKDRVCAIEGTVRARELVTLADAPIEGPMSDLSSHPLILFCGRTHEQKGLDFLCNAFAVAKRHVPTAKLLIIGDGPELCTLVHLCQRLGLVVGRDESDWLGSDVIFAGFRDQPIRYFRIARVFAFPSRYEGLANGLIEAVAAGVPILASDCPHGARSILAGFGDSAALEMGTLPLKLTHGTLMPTLEMPNSLETWAASLVEALSTPLSRRSKEVCLEAISRFDIEETKVEWLKLIKDIVAKHHKLYGGSRQNGERDAE